MARNVAVAYNSLSEQDKAKACILLRNYGEAGAIWVFGDKYGLPKPISGHLQYYIWGPRGYSGEVTISLDEDPETLNLKIHFDQVKAVTDHACRWAIPYEKYLDVYVCRQPKKPLEEMWSDFKRLD
jgi:hypothetical protein